jgi:1,2-diacylglycerol 3-alpha-glucosyltransferase
MRVLLTGQSYYRKDNGQAVFTIRLAEGLARSGHAVMALAPSERGIAIRKVINGVVLQTVPALHLGHNLNVTAFSDGLVEETMDEFNPDIIHIQDHLFLNRTVLRLARRRGLPVVGTNHFLPANWSNNLYIPRSVQGVVHNALWRDMLQVFNQLDAATTPTETAVAILRKQDIRIPVKAISCGVDQDEFFPQPDLNRRAVRKRFKLAVDRPVILFVGRVDREKGLDYLVQAAAMATRDDFQIAIAGKGMYRDMLVEQVHDLSLDGRVAFPGYIASEDLPLLLNSVDAFVMPSSAELQSIATLEAMSCGLPILAANARALPELVEDGVNGYLFVPQNAADLAQTIERFLDRPELWHSMGQAGLQKARPHQLHFTILRYVEWYESVRGRNLMITTRRAGQSSLRVSGD